MLAVANRSKSLDIHLRHIMIERRVLLRSAALQYVLRLSMPM